MKKLASWLGVPSLALLLALNATPASAEIAEGSGEVEIYAGWYSPGPSVVDEEVSYGFRAGYNFGRRSGISGTIGRTVLSETFPAPVGDIDIDAWFVDVSWEWHVNPDSRGVFLLFVGPGWATFNVDGAGDDEDTFSMHFGLGGKIAVTPSFYLRPEARVRWFENRDDDEYDFEVSFGVGWTIGSH